MRKSPGFVAGAGILFGVALVIALTFFVFKNLRLPSSISPAQTPAVPSQAPALPSSSPSLTVSTPKTITTQVVREKITVQISESDLVTPVSGVSVTVTALDSLGRRNLGTPITIVTDADGKAMFDGRALVPPALWKNGFPVNIVADISVAGSLRFKAAMDVGWGGLFWIKKDGGTFSLNLGKTSFYPLRAVGPGAEVSMQASILR